MLLRDAEKEEEEGHSSNEESTGITTQEAESSEASKTEKELRKEVRPPSF